jgi:hypothetical protein
MRLGTGQIGTHVGGELDQGKSDMPVALLYPSGPFLQNEGLGTKGIIILPSFHEKDLLPKGFQVF